MAGPDCECGHPVRSHRWGGANANASYTFLSSCRLCSCDQYTIPGRGETRQDPP